MKIPFNKPYLSGKELYYVAQTIHTGKTAGNNYFTHRCQSFFQEKYGFTKTLLTTSCTDALEMASILINVQEGDEVIVPSYTFVSTANAFVLRGAKIVFIDSQKKHPNLNTDLIEPLITPRTKAIVVVHYAGIACDMDPIMELAKKYDLYVIEDAAQAIDSFYKGRPLGSIGHLAAFSFHETKNIICGEGGMLVINEERFEKRSEIIWEKGTNRSAFFRGEVAKYGWVDIGSSFLPSDMIAAFLFAQLEHLVDIQKKRKDIWDTYYECLLPLVEKGFFEFCPIPDYATNNAHMFFIVCRSFEEQSQLRAFLNQKEIKAVFHYLSLHKSTFYESKHDGRELPECDRFADRLLRLPFYYELSKTNVKYISRQIELFFSKL